MLANHPQRKASNNSLKKAYSKDSIAGMPKNKILKAQNLKTEMPANANSKNSQMEGNMGRV